VLSRVQFQLNAYLYRFTARGSLHMLCTVTAVRLRACRPRRNACHMRAQLGNHFFAKAEKNDLYKYDVKADKDDSVPTPEAADGATVSGKPREFLKYAPMWTAHPDHDRVRSHSGSRAGWALKRQPRQCLQPASTETGRNVEAAMSGKLRAQQEHAPAPGGQ